MKWMMKNSSGKPDGIWTLAVYSWLITSALLLGSVFQGKIEIGPLSFTITSPDSTLLLGYLGATFTGYVVRRNKKDNLEAGIAE